MTTLRNSRTSLFFLVLVVGLVQSACHRNAPRDGAPGALANPLEHAPTEPTQLPTDEGVLHPTSLQGTATDLEPNKKTKSVDLKAILPSLPSLRGALNHWNQLILLVDSVAKDAGTKVAGPPSEIGLGDWLMVRMSKMKFVIQKGTLSAELCAGSLQTDLGGELVACQNLELTKISEAFLKEASEKEKSLVLIDQVWLSFLQTSKQVELNQTGVVAEALAMKMMQPVSAAELATGLQKLKIPVKLKAE